MDTPTPSPQPPTPNLRAAIYARTATADQAGTDWSIEAQLHRCREAARSAGYEVVAEFQDRGVSGATLDRPGLKALWEAIRHDGIGVVIVSGIDRLTRSLADLLSIREELRQAGVELHIASCDNMMGPLSAVLLEQMSTAVGEFERAQFVERMAAARRTKRELGIPPRSRPPFGYRYVGHGEDRRLTVDRTQAAVIQQIVTWVTGSDGNAPLAFDQVMERLRDLPNTASENDAAAAAEA